VPAQRIVVRELGESVDPEVAAAARRRQAHLRAQQIVVGAHVMRGAGIDTLQELVDGLLEVEIGIPHCGQQIGAQLGAVAAAAGA